MKSFGSWKRRFLVTTGVLAALAGLSAVTATPAAATVGCSRVLQNGFERPVAAAHTFDLFVAGQQMGAWTVTRGDVHLIGAGFWQAAEGVQSLDLDGSINGAVALSFPTLPLFTYRISYALAGNPDSGPAIKTGHVLVNGHVIQELAFDITGKNRTNMGYVRHGFAFLSLGGAATLEFVSTTTPGGYGPVLDDVVIEKCLLAAC
jgi:choice-of-anchor C domain-containing protein